MEMEDRVRKLECFMNEQQRAQIRAEERERLELEQQRLREKRKRMAWEFVKVFISPVIAAMATALAMMYFK